jgi:glycosyltransferase involved in cell wall biosynthesis
MRITFVDDSLAFDGFSPSSQPLGGPEKAFASLPTALAQRGHAVEVFNRCAFPVTVENARWETWTGPRPADSEALVAFRKPELLDFVVSAAKRVLWFTGDPALLDDPPARAVLERVRPKVVFFSDIERGRWANPLQLETAVCAAGIAAAYVSDERGEPAEPPRAVATTHPLADLDWLLRLWGERIRDRVPSAELHVYSALLYRGRIGGTVPEAVKPVLDQALALADRGVVIQRPQGDPQMAAAFRAARVHLYPGQAGDGWGASLQESQACGLPAVARASCPASLARIVNGQTGVVCGDDDGFATAAVEFLGERASFDRAAGVARELQRGRTWQVAAAEFEALL